MTKQQWLKPGMTEEDSSGLLLSAATDTGLNALEQTIVACFPQLRLAIQVSVWFKWKLK